MLPTISLKDGCDLKLFGTFEPRMTSVEKAMNFVMSMHELAYISFDSEFGTMKFNESGLDYLKKHGDEIKFFIKKNGLTLSSFGPMAGYMIGLFKDLNKDGFESLNDEYDILDSDKKMDITGTIVTDMNKVVFTKKAPGDIEI